MLSYFTVLLIRDCVLPHLILGLHVTPVVIDTTASFVTFSFACSFSPSTPVFHHLLMHQFNLLFLCIFSSKSIIVLKHKIYVVSIACCITRNVRKIAKSDN